MSIKTSNKLISEKNFNTKLLTWFYSHGRKTLPWQIQKTPYKVWVSEIMLQQTQVATVIPYFARFMQLFPTVHALAKANTDLIMHVWAGLGYYARAANLHRASQDLVAKYDGVFPDQVEELMTLPGIGRSTAAAIVSLAFDKPAAILDGNVKRVLCRVFGIMEPIDTKQVENQLWHIAQQLVPQKNGADYTQGMMDLGALICTKRQPKCGLCPMQVSCLAYQKNMAETLPIKKEKNKKPTKKAAFIVIKKNKCVLLLKKPDQGIWRNLWAFPEIEGALEPLLFQYCEEELSYKIECYELMPSFTHTFTHFHLDITPILVTKCLSLGQNIAAEDKIWYKLDHSQPIGIPKPVRSIMEALI